MTPERARQIAAFLDAQGWGRSERAPLAGDASFRRYERLRRGADRAVLMDAPPPQENVRPFIAIGTSSPVGRSSMTSWPIAWARPIHSGRAWS